MKVHKVTPNQTGLVSILMVMFIMIVLSLIVLAFARLTNREQRQTLDRQLNTQAFYAAESGVNDTVRALTDFPALSGGTYTGCNDFIAAATAAGAQVQPQISAEGPVGYSCLIVDPSPTSLVYGSVGTSSVVIPLRPATGVINRVTIKWSNPGDGVDAPWNDLSGCPDVPTQAQNVLADCEVGMLRLELVRDLSGGRANLADNTAIVFARPDPTSSGASSIIFGDADGRDQGQQVSVNCSPNDSTATINAECTLQIRNLGGMTSGYLRVSSIYHNSEIEVRAQQTAGTDLGLVGSQVAVDVTGRANDVLRRIVTRVPIVTSGNPLAEYAVQTLQGQCKRFTIGPIAPYASIDTTTVPNWCTPVTN